jgi:membrane-bound ClpP family serine protease
MSGRSGYDTTAMVLYILGFVFAVVGLFYLPFLLATIGVALVVTATIMSAENQRLGRYAVTFVGLFWVIGASIAIWNSNPLY